MKRIGNLINTIISSENMFLAFKEARKGKNHKRKVFNFELNLGVNIADLMTQIKNNTYKPKPYRKFILKEPKERIIFAPSFEDIVVQHSIYRVIYPIFEKTFITQSHGCRKNYGTHSASRYLQKSLKQYDEDLYFLQLDIRKYFYSFNREILKTLLEKKIKDKKLIELIMLFAHHESDRGVNFVGYRTWQKYKLVRKHSMYNFKRACKKDKIESIISLVGHAKETKTKEYYRKILLEYDLIDKIPMKVALSLNAV